MDFSPPIRFIFLILLCKIYRNFQETRIHTSVHGSISLFFFFVVANLLHSNLKYWYIAPSKVYGECWKHSKVYICKVDKRIHQLALCTTCLSTIIYYNSTTTWSTSNTVSPIFLRSLQSQPNIHFFTYPYNLPHAAPPKLCSCTSNRPYIRLSKDALCRHHQMTRGLYR